MTSVKSINKVPTSSLDDCSYSSNDEASMDFKQDFKNLLNNNLSSKENIKKSKLI
jgi:hypothetical protein